MSPKWALHKIRFKSTILIGWLAFPPKPVPFFLNGFSSYHQTNCFGPPEFFPDKISNKILNKNVSPNVFLFIVLDRVQCQDLTCFTVEKHFIKSFIIGGFSLPRTKRLV